MATTTGQRFSNGSLNGGTHHLHGHANGGGKYPGAAHHHHMHHLVGSDDDTGGATEQFPPFDPLHDGSEEDEYTHSSTTFTTTDQCSNDGGLPVVNGNGNDNGNGGVAPLFGDEEEEGQGGGQQEQSSNARNYGNSEMDDEEQHSHTPMSNVDPVPESDHHYYHHQQHRDDDTSATSQAATATTTTTTMLSPVTSPPYWALSYTDTLSPSSSRTGGPCSSTHPFNNNSNNLSTESLVPGAITLQDNEAENDHNENDAHGGEPQRNSEETRTSYGRDRNKACWAKSVEVTNYVIVNGSTTNIGAFVVWNIRVQTLSGPYLNIRKRYSEFDDFRYQLIQTFPNFEAAVPVLPPKSIIAKFRPRFLEKRRAGLQYFLNCILLNPEFSGSPVLKDFLFS